MMSELPSGARTADDAIYAAEDGSAKPKQLHAEAASLILAPQPPASMLDVGCAAGAFLGLVHQLAPTVRLSGLEILPSLVARAAARLPAARITEGNLLDGDVALEPAEVVTCLGVLSIFDDPWPALSRLLGWVRPGGRLLISTEFNDDPIDVVLRYRRADQPAAGWETGWNVFAKTTIERLLQGSARVASSQWLPFRLSFDLPRREDPMRTWTIGTTANPHQPINGAHQLVKTSFLLVVMR